MPVSQFIAKPSPALRERGDRPRLRPVGEGGGGRIPSPVRGLSPAATLSRGAGEGTFAGGSASRLFDLDEGAAEILGVEEQHRLAMGTDFRLAVAEDARAGRAEAIARGHDVIDLTAQMMHAAGRVLVEKAAHRGIGAERLQQLDLAIRQLDKNYRDA